MITAREETKARWGQGSGGSAGREAGVESGWGVAQGRCREPRCAATACGRCYAGVCRRCGYQRPRRAAHNTTLPESMPPPTADDERRATGSASAVICVGLEGQGSAGGTFGWAVGGGAAGVVQPPELRRVSALAVAKANCGWGLKASYEPTAAGEGMGNCCCRPLATGASAELCCFCSRERTRGLVCCAKRRLT